MTWPTPHWLGACFLGLMHLAMLSCAGADSTPPAAPLATATPLPSPTTENHLAHDFSFTLFQGEEALGGQELRLSQLRGKPVVLNFWARLCGPCWHEMPELQEFYEEYQDQVILLGIDIGQFTGLGSPRDAAGLLETLGITYPAGFTNDGDVVREYKVMAMPTTVFIHEDGRIYRKWTGAMDRGMVTRMMKAMLK